MGKLKEEYWKKAFQAYEKRLQPFCRFSVIELSESYLPDHPSQSQITQALNSEADRILAAAQDSLLIALCIEGKILPSMELAELIRSSVLHGTSKISFVIGSSFGLSDRVKQKAFLRLSMSAMTFPHQLARVMLVEQIYRSFQIIHNGKYHK
jgi:23S rRNA (pseudouridine1915-N3)-methyltransferase